MCSFPFVVLILPFIFHPLHLFLPFDFSCYLLHFAFRNSPFAFCHFCIWNPFLAAFHHLVLLTHSTATAAASWVGLWNNCGMTLVGEILTAELGPSVIVKICKVPGGENEPRTVITIIIAIRWYSMVRHNVMSRLNDSRDIAHET